MCASVTNNENNILFITNIINASNCNRIGKGDYRKIAKSYFRYKVQLWNILTHRKTIGESDCIRQIETLLMITKS